MPALKPCNSDVAAGRVSRVDYGGPEGFARDAMSGRPPAGLNWHTIPTSEELAMTTPMTTEITRRLESVTRDSFVDRPPANVCAAQPGPYAPVAPGGGSCARRASRVPGP